MANPTPIIIPALRKQTATIICMHGLGDSGSGWSFLAENWRKRGKFEDVKFVFPTAPNIPITVNMGMSMPGWYDISSLDDGDNRSEDEPGVLRTRTYIHSLMNQETADGISSKRIILGGFSQGAVTSVFSGPTFRAALGGVFGLSAYPILQQKFESLWAEAGKHRPPMFLAHGEADPLIRFDWGKKNADLMKERGFEVEWHSYPGLPHSAAPEEIDALETWVTKRLDETKAESL